MIGFVVVVVVFFFYCVEMETLLKISSYYIVREGKMVND